MPGIKKAKTAQMVAHLEDLSSESITDQINRFDPAFTRYMQDIVNSGLTASSALDLVMLLIAEVPTASKESTDHIKLLDKLINTARAMMETKLKTEEAAGIAARIDELEKRIEALTSGSQGSSYGSQEA